MLPVMLLPLHQIEYSIPDAAYQHGFFKQVLGEQDVEQEFLAVLSNPALAIKLWA